MSIVEDLERDVVNIGKNGGMDVNIQDQTSPVLIVRANKVNKTTALTATPALDDATITVGTTTGFINGAFIVLADITSNRYSTFKQVGAVAGNVVTLDSPIDFAYPIATTVVTTGTDNMVSNGSATTQIFSLRASDPGIPLIVDITRVILTCTCTTAVSLATFGDLPALAKGLVLRRVDGTYQNIFNVKSNADITNIVYDWVPYVATNPAQGRNGFSARLTFGGQEKLGSVIKLGPGDDLQFLVQDDLVTAATMLTLYGTFEGHVVVSDKEI
jgi:hypothetical protein